MVRLHNGICSCKKERGKSIWMGMERLPRYSVKWEKQGQNSVLWYANFCVNKEENNKMYAQRNFERIAKKLKAGEKAVQWA